MSAAPEKAAMDLYALLGVSRTANLLQIKAGYRAAAKKHHPDAGGDPEVFQQVAIAFTVLSDKEKREAYDRTGSVDTASAQNIMSGVAQCFADMLDKILEQTKGRMSEVNLAGYMRQAIEQAHAQLLGVTADVTARLRDLEDIQKRLKRRDGEKNVFEDILTKRIQGAAHELAQLRENKKIAERALLELENYESPVNAFQSVMTAYYATPSSSAPGHSFFRVMPV